MALLSGDAYLNAMHLFVQALIWTTMVALLYTAWIHKQSASAGRANWLAFHLHQTIASVQAIWTVAAIAMIVTILLFTLPLLSQRATAAVNSSCGPATTAVAGYGLPDDNSNTIALCDSAPARPSPKIVGPT